MSPVTRRLDVLLATALLLLAGSRASAAQTLTVNPTSTGPLTISTAVAGQQPAAVSASGGTYSVTTKNNTTVTTITARLSAPLPAGTTLSITLASPGGTAQSMGAVQLTTSAQPVVTGLPNKLNGSNVAITYSFTATTAAGVLALQSVSVILALAP